MQCNQHCLNPTLFPLKPNTHGLRPSGHSYAGVEQAVGQGGRMSLQILMQGGENRSLPSQFSMASLPVVRLKFGEN